MATCRVGVKIAPTLGKATTGHGARIQIQGVPLTVLISPNLNFKCYRQRDGVNGTLDLPKRCRLTEPNLLLVLDSTETEKQRPRRKQVTSRPHPRGSFLWRRNPCFDPNKSRASEANSPRSREVGGGAEIGKLQQLRTSEEGPIERADLQRPAGTIRRAGVLWVPAIYTNCRGPSVEALRLTTTPSRRHPCSPACFACAHDPTACFPCTPRSPLQPPPHPSCPPPPLPAAPNLVPNGARTPPLGIMVAAAGRFVLSRGRDLCTRGMAAALRMSPQLGEYEVSALWALFQDFLGTFLCS